MLSKLQGYLLAGLAAIGAFVLAFLKGMSVQKTKTKVAQKDIELKSHKAAAKTREEQRNLNEQADENADNGDWSGFNR